MLAKIEQTQQYSKKGHKNFPAPTDPRPSTLPQVIFSETFHRDYFCLTIMADFGHADACPSLPNPSTKR